MTVARRGLAVGLACAATLGIASLSRVPATHVGADQAMLRLSWRIFGARVEECRPRSAEELEALAPHMRTAEVCTGGNADYELRVEVDGAEVTRDTLHAGGARGDRPVYVLRDLPVAPGPHDAAVTFRALVPEGYDPGDQPTQLVFDGHVDLAPREIALITLDSAGTSLVQLRR